MNKKIFFPSGGISFHHGDLSDRYPCACCYCRAVPSLRVVLVVVDELSIVEQE
jgi:hypothetical protein